MNCSSARNLLPSLAFSHGGHRACQHPQGVPPPIPRWSAVSRKLLIGVSRVARAGCHEVGGRRSALPPLFFHSLPYPPFGIAAWIRRCLRFCFRGRSRVSPASLQDLFPVFHSLRRSRLEIKRLLQIYKKDRAFHPGRKRSYQHPTTKKAGTSRPFVGCRRDNSSRVATG